MEELRLHVWGLVTYVSSAYVKKKKIQYGTKPILLSHKF